METVCLLGREIVNDKNVEYAHVDYEPKDAEYLKSANDKIKVWKSFVDDEHILKDEAMLDRMSHYVRLFKINKSNDRETVLKNTYSLNELLHKKDIDENLRSQFVGTSLLYIKDLLKKKGAVLITKEFVDSMKEFWSLMNLTGEN